MPVYDYGHVCGKDEAPLSILSSGVVERTADFWASGLTNIAPPAGADEAHSLGSGFFVSPDGYLLTSYHVVAHATRVKVNYGGDLFPAEIAQVDKTNDLALLKADGHSFKWIPVSREPNAILGEFVFTIGFPNPSLQGWEPKYSDGNISSLDGLRDDPREYQTSVAIQPGNSGGALCDADGAVVGIVKAELNPKAALMSDGALPQSVNYAVKSKFALPLLDAANVVQDLSLPTAGSPPPTARERVRAATAMVIAE
jgi:S1-C subfamily serine protease